MRKDGRNHRSEHRDDGDLVERREHITPSEDFKHQKLSANTFVLFCCFYGRAGFLLHEPARLHASTPTRESYVRHDYGRPSGTRTTCVTYEKEGNENQSWTNEVAEHVAPPLMR